jgi:hypothetical protein
VTFLAPLARAAQGKHGNVRILARSYGTAKTQLSSSVQLFLSIPRIVHPPSHCVSRVRRRQRRIVSGSRSAQTAKSAARPSLLRRLFNGSAITAGSQKIDSQVKKL